jgi:hypothetical protein
MQVDPLTLAMVEAARAAGASANSAGSGGAVVGTLPDADMWPQLLERLESVGARAIRPQTP